MQQLGSCLRASACLKRHVVVIWAHVARGNVALPGELRGELTACVEQSDLLLVPYVVPAGATAGAGDKRNRPVKKSFCHRFALLSCAVGGAVPHDPPRRLACAAAREGPRCPRRRRGPRGSAS